MFDSGVGGLTVAHALLDLMPDESLVYLGDTARSPYGPRPLEEIREFSIEIARYLVDLDVKAIVVACNSVEVAAIADVAISARVPVIGVIDPGVRAAAEATRSGMVGVIGTEATIASGAYDRAVDRTGRPIALLSYACPPFVDFVESGDTSSDELRAVAHEYLDPIARTDVDTLILGCTHYPLIADVVGEVMGPGVVLVSSAVETAKDVHSLLERESLDRGDDEPPQHDFLCTGDPEQFRELAELFLGRPVEGARRVELEPVGGGR